MTVFDRPDRSTTLLLGGVGLLERSINYTLGSLSLISGTSLEVPTLCRPWTLRELLLHLDDSLLALHEAVDLGQIEMYAEHDGFEADPVGTVRERASRLIGAWSGLTAREVISVAGTPLTSAIVTGTGAIEIAVHGWDIAQATGRPHPLPPALAEELLELAPLFVSDADRPDRFGMPLEAPPGAGPMEQLLCFLGRKPGTEIPGG